jgi:hypothetical protein
MTKQTVTTKVLLLMLLCFALASCNPLACDHAKGTGVYCP